MGTDRATALREAEKLLRTGKLPQALEEYERVVEADQDDWETRQTLCQLYVRAGSPEKGVERLASAADILLRSGDATRAASMYSKVLAMRPHHEGALLQLGEIALADGRTSDAAARFATVADQRDARGDRRGAGELRIRISDICPNDVEARLKGARARLELDPRTPLAPSPDPWPAERGTRPLAAVPAPAQPAVAPTAVAATTAPRVVATIPAPIVASTPGVASDGARAIAAPAAPVAPVAASPRVAAPREPHTTIAAKKDMASVVRNALSPRGRMIAAVAALVLLVAGVAFFGRQHVMPAAAAETTGTVVVNTNPAGADVTIDGRIHGKTPFQQSLNPGKHQLEIVSGDEHRTIPVTITAGSQVSQFIELPHAAPSRGQLQVRSEPSGATVIVDGQRRGTAPLKVEDLEPGVHVVNLEGPLGSVTHQVTIDAGATASLVVPMGAPQGVPVSGWIAISAPVDVQVFENQRMLGSSRLDRIMMSVGRHDLDFVNDAVGYRSSRAVQVSPGQVSTVKLEMPKGSIALNAQPWADVWVDGEHIGETPIGNLALAVGQHEVIFRHPELGERRMTPTVTLQSPARVSVDMRNK
jgi:tetratricopeptide (TPR) repeat protein